MSVFFKNLKEKIFGKTEDSVSIDRHDAHPSKEGLKEEKTRVSVKEQPPPVQKPKRPQREPYFIQIGLDFGTAYCKCVCRDIFLDKAWVHIPSDSEKAELPFLITSSIQFENGSFQRGDSTNGSYIEGGLSHVKMALQKVALEEWDDQVLQPFRKAASKIEEPNVIQFVEACAIYLLAGILGNVKKEIKSRFKGSVDGDYEAVNLAVPVADANHPVINQLFDRALRRAWVLAEKLVGHPCIPYTDLVSLIVSNKEIATKNEIKEGCFIYPEVSANVQGFVRSRTSSPGLYLFSDTGAGTVDQSVFLFSKRDGQEHLNYLHAEILPLGSSLIERLAAKEDGNNASENLESWRQRKEAGEKNQHLLTAQHSVHSRLERGTVKTIALSKKKLYNPRQISDLRIIFGGGGHCEMPYLSAVMKQFDGGLFHPVEIKNRRNKNDSFNLGMPIPIDLPIKDSQRRWMDRLTVAYGLSFERGQLATFTLPNEVDVPKEEEIWRPVRAKVTAPTSDDV